MNIIPLNEWLDTGGKPLVISGPCSAETQNQVMETARQLSKISQVKVFRREYGSREHVPLISKVLAPRGLNGFNR